MLFRKKAKENIKVAKFRMLEPAPTGGRISGRLAMGLAAPFVIVALFLWIFSKQATVVSKPKTNLLPPPSTTLPAITQAPLPMNPAGLEAEAKTEPGPTIVPKAEEKPPASPVKKVDVPTTPPAKPPVKETSPTSPRTKDFPVKPPLVKKGTQADKPIKIKKGRPRSPIEENVPESKKQSPSDKAEKPAEEKEGQKEQPLPAPQETPKDIPPSSPKPPALLTQTSPTASDRPKSGKKIEGLSRSYRIQVGSFQKKEDAAKMAFRFKERGYAVSVVIAKVPDKGTWHRVWVGTYPDRAQAQHDGQALSKAEKVSFFIVTANP